MWEGYDDISKSWYENYGLADDEEPILTNTFRNPKYFILTDDDVAFFFAEDQDTGKIRLETSTDEGAIGGHRSFEEWNDFFFAERDYDSALQMLKIYVSKMDGTWTDDLGESVSRKGKCSKAVSNCKAMKEAVNGVCVETGDSCVKITPKDEEDQEEEDVAIDFEDFSEEDIDELGEAYLKRVYENVQSYKTTSGSIKGNKMVFEGLITFKSGRTKPTKFVFEAKQRTKTGKLRFLGENKELSANSRAFTLVGQKQGKRLVCEALRYNYTVKDNNTGYTTPINGVVHTTRR